MDFLEYKEAEWSDMNFYYAAAKLIKIVNVTYGMEQEKEHLHAAGDAAISIQKGNRKGTGQMIILKGALDDLNLAAVAAGGRDILDLEGEAVIDYVADSNRPMQTDTLIGVQFTKYDKSWAQGDKKMEITIPFLFLDMKSV